MKLFSSNRDFSEGKLVSIAFHLSYGLKMRIKFNFADTLYLRHCFERNYFRIHVQGTAPWNVVIIY